jgi:hypothetical protein
MINGTKFNESGQLLLIGILLLALLFVSIPWVVFLNQSTTRFGLSISKREKSMNIAQEGLAYATHVLSADPVTWALAMAGGVQGVPPAFLQHPPTAPYTGSNGSPLRHSWISAIFCSAVQRRSPPL